MTMNATEHVYNTYNVFLDFVPVLLLDHLALPVGCGSSDLHQAWTLADVCNKQHTLLTTMVI